MVFIYHTLPPVVLFVLVNLLSGLMHFYTYIYLIYLYFLGHLLVIFFLIVEDLYKNWTELILFNTVQSFDYYG